MKTISKKNVAILQMLACASLWSISGILFKMLPWNPFVISGSRSLIAGLVLFIYIKYKDMPVIINKKTLIPGLTMCLMYICFVIANKLTTAANAIVLQFTSPVFIMVFSALLLKQKFRRTDLVTVICTLLGISLFFLDQLSPGHMLGNLFGIAAGMFMAGMYIFVGNANEDEKMSSILLAQIFTLAVSIPFIAVTKPEITPVSIFAVLTLGVLQLGIPYILYARATEHCPPLACSLLGAMEPLLNPVWVFLFSGEAPGLFALIGGVIVIGTVTLWCIFGDKSASPQADC